MDKFDQFQKAQKFHEDNTRNNFHRINKQLSEHQADITSHDKKRNN